MNITALGWLFLAHFLGDFAFQTTWMATMKAKLIYVMWAHTAVWTLVISLMLQHLGLMAGWKPLFLFFGHFVIDEAKIMSKEEGIGRWFYIDQLLHFSQLAVVCLL